MSTFLGQNDHLEISNFFGEKKWNNSLKSLLNIGEPWYYHNHFVKFALEEAFRFADWKRVRNTFAPVVPKGYRVYKAEMPGVLNMVAIEKLPQGALLNVIERQKIIDWSEPVEVRKYFQTTGGYQGEVVNTTYLVTRMEGEEEVFEDIFLGSPISPRKYRLDGFCGEGSITREEALSAGYEWALADVPIMLPEEERERLEQEEYEYDASYDEPCPVKKRVLSAEEEKKHELMLEELDRKEELFRRMACC